MFIVRRELLENLLKDPEWTRKLTEAKTIELVKKVLVAFTEAKGLKVINLMAAEKTVTGGDRD